MLLTINKIFLQYCKNKIIIKLSFVKYNIIGKQICILVVIFVAWFLKGNTSTKPIWGSQNHYHLTGCRTEAYTLGVWAIGIGPQKVEFGDGSPGIPENGYHN